MGVRSNRVSENSQGNFAEKTETVIIFDWDDTLFPRTNLSCDCHVSLRKPLDDQKLPDVVKTEIFQSLAQCTEALEQLLRLATSCGKVLLVTLAKESWVTFSCDLFLPRIGELLKELNVEIVYAGQGIQIERNKLREMAVAEQAAFWSRVKGETIANVVSDFYSQYDGQSWKNIISVGDSEYERLGTWRATEEYMRDNGIAGHCPKVRTKTLKFMDQPTIKELVTQLDVLQQWLPIIVSLDDNLDIDISGLMGLKGEDSPTDISNETVGQKINQEMSQLYVSA